MPEIGCGLRRFGKAISARGHLAVLSPILVGTLHRLLPKAKGTSL
jgi:hypothetical protein